MMMNIKEKIQKLLSLATSPNENEARSALLKAKELMLKHKLTEADFEDEGEELTSLVSTQVSWTTDSGNIWMARLADMIAENYCCVAAWQTRRGTRTHTLVVTGLKSDAEVCLSAIEYAVGFVLGQFKVLERKYRSQNPKTVKYSYANGFCNGMEMAFELQKDEHPEWGLVEVKPEEVKKYGENLKSKNVRTKTPSVDPLAYMKGQNDGLEFNKKKALKG